MAALVNGPEGDALEWGSINWPRVEREVRRLRQRIFTASQAGDLKKVRNLQKLMLRSRANALMSVRRVTELNAGRKTAGVDGKVVVSAPGKAVLADRVRRAHTVTAQPVKRVYVPKANGKQESAELTWQPPGCGSTRALARGIDLPSHPVRALHDSSCTLEPFI